MGRMVLLLVFLVGGVWPGQGAPAQTAGPHIVGGPPLTDSLSVDSLEKRAFLGLNKKTGKAIDSVPYETTQAMGASERLGNTHGKAVALAYQAIYMNMHKDDFIRAEQLARQSLDAFGHTGNQGEIIRAHYALGFSLFAQSRYDEALYCYKKAGEDASRSGNCTEEIYMLSLQGEAYQERGDYEKAFDIQRQCIQVAEFLHHSELVNEEYLTLAELFVQIEDYGSAEKYFRIGFGTRRPEQTNPWDMMVYAELLTRQRKYDSALYYYGQFDSAHAGQGMLKAYLASKGEYYLFRCDYATALPYFINSLGYQHFTQRQRAE